MPAWKSTIPKEHRIGREETHGKTGPEGSTGVKRLVEARDYVMQNSPDRRSAPGRCAAEVSELLLTIRQDPKTETCVDRRRCLWSYHLTRHREAQAGCGSIEPIRQDRCSQAPKKDPNSGYHRRPAQIVNSLKWRGQRPHRRNTTRRQHALIHAESPGASE